MKTQMKIFLQRCDIELNVETQRNGVSVYALTSTDKMSSKSTTVILEAEEVEELKKLLIKGML